MTNPDFAKLAGEFEFESTVGNSIIAREPVGVVGASCSSSCSNSAICWGFIFSAERP